MIGVMVVYIGAASAVKVEMKCETHLGNVLRDFRCDDAPL